MIKLQKAIFSAYHQSSYTKMFAVPDPQAPTEISYNNHVAMQ
jgi:hypothetical protein